MSVELLFDVDLEQQFVVVLLKSAKTPASPTIGLGVVASSHASTAFCLAISYFTSQR